MNKGENDHGGCSFQRDDFRTLNFVFRLFIVLCGAADRTDCAAGETVNCRSAPEPMREAVAREENGIMEIKFTEIQSKDQLLIQTANSEYRFNVIDPEGRRGRLSGGTLGNGERDAVLVGSVSATGALADVAPAMRTGGRAVFYLTGKQGVEHLITSVIQKIFHPPSPN